MVIVYFFTLQFVCVGVCVLANKSFSGPHLFFLIAILIKATVL